MCKYFLTDINYMKTDSACVYIIAVSRGSEVFIVQCLIM